MSTFQDKAKKLRESKVMHYNCCQATLLAFAEAAGVDDNTMLKVSSNFGSGMKRGSVCGAIVGGLMALGLFGIEDSPTIAKYHKALREAHDSHLDCADLLRINQEKGGDRGAHCDGMVYECVGLVEDILKEKGLV